MSEMVYNSTLEKNIKNYKFVIDESKYLPVVLLLPSVLIILFVVGIPMIYSLFLSFTDFTLLKSTDYNIIGINNYISLFKNSIFWQSFGKTVIYIAVAVNVEFILGLVIANMMSHIIRGQNILRTIMMMPMMFAPILVGFQFKWFLSRLLMTRLDL